MKAFWNKDRDQLILKAEDNEPVVNMPKFKRFVGGVGWAIESKTGDYAKNWVCIFGEQEDGRIMHIEECFGSLSYIGSEMINLKDRYLCEGFCVNAADIHNQKVRYLRGLEGLTYYEKKQGVIREIYPTDTTTWPNFRNSRPTASVIPVPDNVKADIDAGFGQLRALAIKKDLVFHQQVKELPRLVVKFEVRERKPEETLSHPVVSAGVFAVSMILRSRPEEGTTSVKRHNPYGNRERQ